MSKRSMLKMSLALGRRALFSPAQAAREARKEENLRPALYLYSAFLLGYMLFFWIKPANFPDTGAALPGESQSLLFWLKVMIWQPPLEAAWILFLMGFIVWFRSGGLPLRLAAATAWTALPFILMAAYVQKGGIPKWAFGAAATAAFALFYPLLRKAPARDLKPVITFMLSINVIGLVLLAPMSAVVLIGHSGFFNFSQIVGGLWILGVGTLGLRELTGLRLPRAFMSLLFSMFFQVAFAFTLHLLGLVPKEILKALLYA